MLEFAKGCDYALQMVDEILNTLTRGEHSKTVNLIEERKKLQEEEERQKKLQEELSTEWNYVTSLSFTPGDGSSNSQPTESPADDIDFDAVRSLSELGIDTSFVDEFEQESKKRYVDTCCAKCNHIFVNVIQTIVNTLVNLT